MNSTKQVADYISVSPQTIREYCDQFGDHLSDFATPPKGETRRFTEEDKDTLYSIRQMLMTGATYDAVRGMLERGAHRLDEFQPPPEQPEPQPAAMVPVDQVRSWVEPLHDAVAEWKEIARERQSEIDSLREENRKLREELRQPETEERRWWQFWK